MDHKLQIKAHQSKIGSLDNVKHKPGGGDKRIFNDVEYMRQVSDNAASITNASGPGSLTSSRRESASQVCMFGIFHCIYLSQSSISLDIPTLLVVFKFYVTQYMFAFVKLKFYNTLNGL